MQIRDLIPWGNNRGNEVAKREEDNPVLSLQRDVNRSSRISGNGSINRSAHSDAWMSADLQLISLKPTARSRYRSSFPASIGRMLTSL